MQKKSVKAVGAACIALAAGLGCGGDGGRVLPPQARWHNNQGVVYMDQHNYVRGREHFEEAARLAPGYATARANLGIALYSLGKYDSARVALGQALERDGGHLHALYTLGLIDHAQGRDYAAALDRFRKVAARDGEDPLVWYFLGRTHAKVGRADSAVAAYERAIALDPTHLSAHYALAQELRQQGDLEAWRRTLDRFDQLSRAGVEGVSSAYQGQGKYAEALAEGRFGGGGAGSAGGLRFRAASDLAAGEGPLLFLTPVDADGDGDADVVAGTGRGPLLLNNGDDGLLAGAAWDLEGVPAARGLVFADVDDDGDADAAWSGDVLRLLRQDEGGRFRLSDESLAPAPGTALFGDVDHDGDADLIAAGPGLVLWANDGTGAFADATAAARLAVPGVETAVLSDFDDDRDVDILAGGRSLGLYGNNRDGTFTDAAGRRGLEAGGVTGLAVADLDPDGRMDVLVVTAGGARLHANRGTTFEAVPVPAPDGARQVLPADFDNDGDLDLLWVGPEGARAAAGQGSDFQPAGADLGPGPWAILDADGDGRLDVLAGRKRWLNDSDAGNWLAVDLSGRNSNPDGFGAKVVVSTALGQQKRELRGGAGDPPLLHFGLAGSDSVEFVSVLWPSGVRQTELASAAGRRLELMELDRKGTSCPVLYAWDGSGFGFVSDFLGGAIIGYLTAPGQYYTPDTDEYLPLRRLEAKDGSYVLQVANQLEEIVYLDAAELVAVDHPAGLRLEPNERLLSAPPYPPFRTYAVSRTRPLASARDGEGRDAGAELARIDDIWYEGFARSDIHGYAGESTLILDLGDLRDWPHPVLLAHGWVDYAHSSSNWAASQRGLGRAPPRLEVDHGEGWRLATADMGTPAGLPKTMLVDLDGLFPAGTETARLRITTRACVYWDQFLLGQAAPEAPRRVHRRRFEADLHWRGYPAHESVRGTFAFRYHYERLRTEAPWGTHAGAFTRHGDVTELVAAVDDRFAILRHGDELTLEVEAGAFPPVPAGWERTFLLYADGFGKDMDFHSAHSLTVEPLPFHGMSRYPYGPDESYPATPEHVRYVLDYNTRWVKGYYR